MTPEQRDAKIKKIKCLRVEVKAMIENIVSEEQGLAATPKSKDGFYAMSIAKRKLQEARMWLGVGLQSINDYSPYIEADNPSNAIVHTEADVPEEAKEKRWPTWKEFETAFKRGI